MDIGTAVQRDIGRSISDPTLCGTNRADRDKRSRGRKGWGTQQQVTQGLKQS